MAANIQPYKRQLTPSGRGRIAPRPLPYYSNYHLRALSTLGRATTNVAASFVERLAAAERDTQVSNSEVASLKEWNSFQQKMRQNPQGADFLPGKQTSGWLDEWEKGRPQRIKAILENITNPTARKIAERRYERSEAVRAGMIQGDAWKQSAQNQEDSYKMNLTYLLNAPMQTEQDRDNLIEQVQMLHLNAAKNNLSGMHLPGIGKDKSAAQNAIDLHTQSINERFAKQERGKLLDQQHEIAKAMPYDEAISYLNDVKGLTSAERNDLIARRKRVEAQAKEELEAQQKKDREALFDRFKQKDYTNIEDFIDSLSLEPEEKISRLEQAERRAEAILKEEDDPFLKRTSQKKYFEFIRQAIKDPTGLKEPEVAAAVGREKDGISIPDYEHIITEKEDPASALKRSEVKFYVDQINAMDVEAWEKSKMMDALRDFMRRNPEANISQIQAFWDREIEEVTLNWWERLWRSKERGQFFGLVTSEREKLRKKKIESLKEKGLWEELPEEEKRAMLGRTTEEEEISEMIDEELEAIIRGG